MKFRVISILFLLAAISTEVISQSQSGTNPIRTCATMTQDSINKILFPQRQTLDEFEYSDRKSVV